MIVHKISKEDWIDKFSENAHAAVFGCKKPRSCDRVDYAIVAVDEADAVVAYVTIHEMDSTHVYWQYGGVIEKFRGTVKSFKGIQAGVEWCGQFYMAITTMIENTNIEMLRVAWKLGFRINGVRVVAGKIFVEHIYGDDHGHH